MPVTRCLWGGCKYSWFLQQVVNSWADTQEWRDVCVAFMILAALAAGFEAELPAAGGGPLYL